MEQPALDIWHNMPRSRFECTVEGHLCVADYRIAGQVMQMTHTEVHPSLQGRGIAAALVKAALGFARSQGHTVDPRCSYVRVYMQRHPQSHSLNDSPEP